MSKKKDAKDAGVEEIIDEALLPPWNPSIFAVAPDLNLDALSFYQKLRDMTASRVSVVSRHELIQFAKAKAIFVEQVMPKGSTEPPPEPDTAIFIQALKEKLAELDKQGRRAKYDKEKAYKEYKLAEEQRAAEALLAAQNAAASPSPVPPVSTTPTVAPPAKGKPEPAAAAKDSKGKDKAGDKSKEPEKPVLDVEPVLVSKDEPDWFYCLEGFPKDARELHELASHGIPLDTVVHLVSPATETKTEVEAEAEAHTNAEEGTTADSNQNEDIQTIQEDSVVAVPLLLQGIDSVLYSAPTSSSLRNLQLRVVTQFKQEPLQVEEGQPQPTPAELDAYKKKEMEESVNRVLSSVMTSGKERMKYQEWAANTVAQPLPELSIEPLDMRLYQRMAESIEGAPAADNGARNGTNMSTSLLLHCLVEQVVRAEEGPELVAKHETQRELSETETYLDQMISKLVQQRPTTPAVDDSYNFSAHLVAPSVGQKSPVTVIAHGDDILSRCHHAFFPGGFPAAAAERHILQRLFVPGSDRFKMPSRPIKTKEQRGAEKTSMYPFSRLETHEFDRNLTLLKFEDIFSEAQPERQWQFGDRVYEERFTKETMKQVLYKATLLEPDMCLHYSERDDALFVGVYHRNPPGRILRKQWTGPWRVKPSLPLWLSTPYFYEQPPAKDLYDLDERKVGRVRERVKYVFPCDDSIIRITQTEAGAVRHSRPLVIHDDLVFGVRSIPITDSNPDSTLNQQIWAAFADGSRFLAETVSVADNGRRSKISLTVANGLIVQFLHNGGILQTNEKAFASSTSSSNSELASIVNRLAVHEKSRCITGKGSVIRYFSDESIQILFANGNVSTRDKDGKWEIVNEKGLRKGVSPNGLEYSLPAVPTATQTDPETMAKVITRQDLVMVIKYSDGSSLVQHADGTKMQTSADCKFIRVEKAGFASVKVELSFEEARAKQKGKRPPATAASSTVQNPFANNDAARFPITRIYTTSLPDGTTVVSGREDLGIGREGMYPNIEDQDGPGREVSHVTVQRLDGTVLKSFGRGEIHIISGAVLAKKKQRRTDSDAEPTSRARSSLEEEETIAEDPEGVYIGSTVEGRLSTTDGEGNRFDIYADGTSRVKLAVSVSEEAEGRPKTPELSDGISIDSDAQFLPPPSRVNPPRLFVVLGSGEGYELLRQQEVDEYFRKIQNDGQTVVLPTEAVADIPNAFSHTVMVKMQAHNQPAIPDIVLPKIVAAVPQSVSSRDLLEPIPTVVQYRTFIKHPELTEEKRTILMEDLERHKVWKEIQDKDSAEFGVADPRSEEEKQQEIAIQQKILALRKERRSLPQKTVASETQQTVKNVLSTVTVANGPSVQESSHQGMECVAEEETTDQTTKTGRKNMSSRGVVNAMSSSIQAEQHKAQRTRKLLENGGNKPSAPLSSVQVSVALDTRNYFLIGDELDQHRLTAPPKPVKTAIAFQEQQQVPSDEENIDPEDLQHEYSEHVGPLEHLSPSSPGKSNNRTPNSYKAHFNQNQQFTTTRTTSQPNDEGPRESITPADYLKQKSSGLDVYGNPRKKNMKHRASVESLPNERYLNVESTADRRIRTVSTSGKVNVHAPSAQETRKMGTHILSAETMKARTMLDTMGQTGNGSTLRGKSFEVFPTQTRFGPLRLGCIYRTTFTVTNVDVDANRYNVRQPQNPLCRVIVKPGLVAAGMSVKLEVELVASEIGLVEDHIEIVTKTDILILPLFANVLAEDRYDSLDRESYAIHGRPAKKSSVRMINFEDSVISANRSRRKPLDETSSVMRTVDSDDAALPVIPDQYPIEIDPSVPVEEIQRRHQSRTASPADVSNGTLHGTTLEGKQRSQVQDASADYDEQADREIEERMLAMMRAR